MTKSTVESSMTSRWSTGVKFGRSGEPKFGSITLPNVYLTSAAVKGWPLWNLTPGRKWNV
ncbi:MAG: hypothetical protein JO352_36545 [Chloroflexi bacterium]|nr:hypothetical protein [Chloroflexota bacterium]